MLAPGKGSAATNHSPLPKGTSLTTTLAGSCSHCLGLLPAESATCVYLGLLRSMSYKIQFHILLALFQTPDGISALWLGT